METETRGGALYELLPTKFDEVTYGEGGAVLENDGNLKMVSANTQDVPPIHRRLAGTFEPVPPERRVGVPYEKRKVFS